MCQYHSILVVYEPYFVPFCVNTSDILSDILTHLMIIWYFCWLTALDGTRRPNVGILSRQVSNCPKYHSHALWTIPGQSTGRIHHDLSSLALIWRTCYRMCTIMYLPVNFRLQDCRHGCGVGVGFGVARCRGNESGVGADQTASTPTPESFELLF